MTRIVALLIGLVLLAAAPSWAAEACSAGPGVLQFMSGGTAQRVDLVLPAGASRDKRVPLVIGLHPSGGTGATFDDYAGLSVAAVPKGFAVLLPNGALTSAQGSGRFWNIPGVPLVSGEPVPAGTRDDVRFLADAIDAAVGNQCIDARRVYVTGFSGGARMSSMVACRLADRIAAVAPVAGLRAGRAAGPGFTEPDPVDCRPSKPVRVLAIHGTDDRTNPFPGGGGVRWGYSVEQAAARWAALDGCGTGPRSEPVAMHVTRLEFGGCKAAGTVTLYRIDAPEAEGGGHIWPGGRGTPPSRLRATDLVLEFFGRP